MIFNFISCLIVLPYLLIAPNANEWHGIVPLHTTRTDVERILGKAGTDRREGATYKSGTEKVWVVYSSGPCEGPRGGWNVPSDTVVEISVFYSDPKPKFADLKIDESNYQRVTEGDALNFLTFRNEHEGIAYVVNVLAGFVSSARYFPSTRDDHLRCSARPTNPDDGIADSRKFDSYQELSISQENRRLDDFGTQLSQYEPEAKGYIIIYPVRSTRLGEAQEHANRAKTYLVTERRIKAERLVTIIGGYRDVSTTELWIRSKGHRAPVMLPAIQTPFLTLNNRAT